MLPSADTPKAPAATSRSSVERLEKMIAIVPQHIRARNKSQAINCLILTVCVAVPSGRTRFFPSLSAAEYVPGLSSLKLLAFSDNALSPATLRVSALQFRNGLGPQQDNDRYRFQTEQGNNRRRK